MNDKTCINCIHKDVCYMYRLNYIGAREGYCTNYYEEPKKGKWIHREDMDYLDENKVAHIHFMCGKCGFIHDFIDGHTSQYNFCPNCGAEMEADDEQ